MQKNPIRSKRQNHEENDITKFKQNMSNTRQCKHDVPETSDFPPLSFICKFITSEENYIRGIQLKEQPNITYHLPTKK